MANRVTGKLKLSVLTTSILAAMYAPNVLAAEEEEVQTTTATRPAFIKHEL